MAGQKINIMGFDVQRLTVTEAANSLSLAVCLLSPLRCRRLRRESVRKLPGQPGAPEAERLVEGRWGAVSNVNDSKTARERHRPSASPFGTLKFEKAATGRP